MEKVERIRVPDALSPGPVLPSSGGRLGIVTPCPVESEMTGDPRLTGRHEEVFYDRHENEEEF